MKTIDVAKRSTKRDREHQVLIGLIDYYLKTNKPVGSNTLKEAGFEDLSSATIRNYFAKLENEGFLIQHHASGGRIPTSSAFRFYATLKLETSKPSNEYKESLKSIRDFESREVAAFLQNSADTLSALAGTAVFLSAPRFDQDYVTAIRLVGIDHTRCLCVLITDFGVIRTEVINLEQKPAMLILKRLESYFNWRLTGLDQPENFSSEEEELAKRVYNELMVRYLVSYSTFVDTEIYRTGFSKLLNFKQELVDPAILADGLSLFENTHNLKLLIRECCKHGHLKFWIGEDLSTYSTASPNCSVIAIPYYINAHIAGAVGLLGPVCLRYGDIFNILRIFSANISEALTKNLFKHKITFRQPHSGMRTLEHSKEQLFLLT